MYSCVCVQWLNMETGTGTHGIVLNGVENFECVQMKEVSLSQWTLFNINSIVYEIGAPL